MYSQTQQKSKILQATVCSDQSIFILFSFKKKWGPTSTTGIKGRHNKRPVYFFGVFLNRIFQKKSRCFYRGKFGFALISERKFHHNKRPVYFFGIFFLSIFPKKKRPFIPVVEVLFFCFCFLKNEEKKNNGNWGDILTLENMAIWGVKINICQKCQLREIFCPSTTKKIVSNVN